MKRYIKSTIASVRTLNDWISENKSKDPNYKYVWVLDQDEPNEFIFSDGTYSDLVTGAGLTDTVVNRYKNINIRLPEIYSQYEVLEEIPYDDGGIAICIGKLY